MKKEQYNLVLIGFMGTGKTSAGKVIARKMKREFVDIDEKIEAAAGHSISKIFERKGEKCFRVLESNIIRKISKQNMLVISTGGGAVLNPLNIKRLKKNGIIIAFLSKVMIIFNKISAQKDKRPLLSTAKRTQGPKKMRVLLNKRMPLYTASADYVFDTSNLTPAKTAKEVLSALKRK